MEAKLESDDSLSRFFGGVDGMKKKLADVLTSDEYAEFRKEAVGWIDAVKIPGIAGIIVDRIDDVMETPIAPALKKVYGKSNVLYRYLDRDKYDPEESITVELAEHTVTSDHAPHLDIIVNGRELPPLKLDIKLALDLEGLILTIRDARIWKISPGSCRGSGSVAFYGKSLLKKESASYALPTIDFEHGIPIAP